MKDKTLVRALAVTTIINTIAIAGSAIFIAQKAQQMDEDVRKAKETTNNTVSRFAQVLGEFKV